MHICPLRNVYKCQADFIKVNLKCMGGDFGNVTYQHFHFLTSSERVCVLLV